MMTTWPTYEQLLQAVPEPWLLFSPYCLCCSLHVHPKEGFSASLSGAPDSLSVTHFLEFRTSWSSVLNTGCTCVWQEQDKVNKKQARGNENPFHFWPALPSLSRIQKAVSVHLHVIRLQTTFSCWRMERLETGEPLFPGWGERSHMMAVKVATEMHLCHFKVASGTHFFLTVTLLLTVVWSLFLHTELSTDYNLKKCLELQAADLLIKS